MTFLSSNSFNNHLLSLLFLAFAATGQAQNVELLLQQQEALERHESDKSKILQNDEETTATLGISEVTVLQNWPRQWPQLLEQALSSSDWNTTRPVRLALPQAEGAPFQQGEIWQVNQLLYVGTIYPVQPELEFLSRQGIKTLVSFDVSPPDPLLARANGMSWVHIPTFGHEISAGDYLRLIRVFTFMEGTYYLHAGPGETRAYPVAALSTKWMENRYIAAPLRPLFTLYALGYSPEHYFGWLTVLSPLVLIQEEYQPYPANFASLNIERPLKPTMQQLQAWLDAIQDTQQNNWQTPPHLAPALTQEYAANIAELTTRWAAISEQPEFKTGFESTATQAEALRKALRERNRSGLDAALLGLENTCFHCHQTMRDGVK